MNSMDGRKRAQETQIAVAMDGFEHLARRAREERAPALDVAWRVMRAIEAPRPRFEVNRSVLAAVAGLTIIAASVMLALAVEDWSAWTDPMSGLIQSFTLVLP
jgi:hypothetical protein